MCAKECIRSTKAVTELTKYVHPRSTKCLHLTYKNCAADLQKLCPTNKRCASTYKNCADPTYSSVQHEQLQNSEQLTYSRSDTRTFFNEVCIRRTVQIGSTVQPEAAENHVRVEGPSIVGRM